MAYGQAGRLGESIDPRLAQVDFSPIERAGAAQGQMFANMGGQIGDAMKLRGSEDKFVKTQIQAANAIKKALPDVAPLVDDALAQMSNPDISHRDKVAMAESIQQSLKIGLLGMDQQRADESMMLERMKLAASMQGKEDRTMSLTPEQIDQFSAAGWEVADTYGATQDGRIRVTMQRKAPGIGMPGVVETESGALVLVPGRPTQYSATPNPFAMPSGGGGEIPTNVDQAEAIRLGIDVSPTSPQSQAGTTIDGDRGVLPTRQGQPQPAPQSDFVRHFNTPPSKGDIYQVDAQGRPVRVTREPGSTPEIDYMLKQQELQKGTAETEKARLDAESAKQKAQQLRDAKNNFSDSISAMTGAYSELQKIGGAVETGRGAMKNIGSALAATNIGQTVGGAIGTEEAKYRQVIKSTLPDIINVIRQSSEMGAKGMDTPNERDFYLASAGDPTKPVEANLKALMKLDNVYGNGNAVEKMLQNNPELLRRVRSFDLKFQPPAEDNRASVDKYLSPATRGYLESLNAK